MEKPVIDMGFKDFRANACHRTDVALREFLGEIHHLTAEMDVFAGLAALEHGGVTAQKIIFADRVDDRNVAFMRRPPYQRRHIQQRVRIENIRLEIVKNGFELLLDVEIPLLLDLLHTPLLRRILWPVLEPEIVIVEHAVDADAIAHRFGFGLPLYAGGTDLMSHGDEFLGKMFDRAFAPANDMRRIKAAEMENSHTDTLYFLIENL